MGLAVDDNSAIRAIVPHRFYYCLDGIPAMDRRRVLDKSFQGHIRLRRSNPEAVRDVNIAEEVFLYVHDIDFTEPVIS